MPQAEETKEFFPRRCSDTSIPNPIPNLLAPVEGDVRRFSIKNNKIHDCRRPTTGYLRTSPTQSPNLGRFGTRCPKSAPLRPGGDRDGGSYGQPETGALATTAGPRRADLHPSQTHPTPDVHAGTAVAPLIMTEAVLAASCKDFEERWL